MLRTRIRPEHSPPPPSSSIVSTGFAGRAGRFFGALAQKNQFRISKNAADENPSGALTAAPFFFPSYRPALPVGRGDFSKRQRRKINSASVKMLRTRIRPEHSPRPLLLPSYRPAPPVGRGDYSERQHRKINSASVKMLRTRIRPARKPAWAIFSTVSSRA